ncbi:hypothetical protein C922_04422 [Plasmodium inui San Antonio 1]|uniref:Uncharacterized protein n=1 Tax=Plasmodium inui San Antonio 1 TaxID=1237626 RepID=W7AIL3_9APIC|nr:hypothetical protein C922_04422 [Plasmodium inui San Antonio 1]EUD65136.1 hypothetical protein C922_04422 [Plasmodium inui San Antonio 1]
MLTINYKCPKNIYKAFRIAKWKDSPRKYIADIHPLLYEVSGNSRPYVKGDGSIISNNPCESRDSEIIKFTDIDEYYTYVPFYNSRELYDQFYEFLILVLV